MRAIIDIANFQIIDEPPAPNDPPSPQNEGTHHLEISGFIPDKLSTNVLRLYPGRCANDNGFNTRPSECSGATVQQQVLVPLGL